MKVTIDYTNWRGERRKREIVPTGRIAFMSTDFHNEMQWLLDAVDCEDGCTKQFALKDIHSWEPSP
jgi:hypothetical protein